MKRFVLLSALFIVLAGCAAPHSDLLFKDKALVSGESGLILASLGTTVPRDAAADPFVSQMAITVFYRPAGDANASEAALSTEANGFMNAGWKDTQVVRTTERARRLLVGYAIKPGRYEVTRIRVEIPGLVAYKVEFRPPGNSEFGVVPGQVTYLGAFEVENVVGTNVLGTRVPASARLAVHDEAAEDFAHLDRLRPELRGAPRSRAVAGR